MRMQTKKMLDYYAGGVLMALLKPWVWLLGQILRRNHSPELQGDICFIKMLGGGSLIIAFQALLGLRHRYPSNTFSLITTKEIKPFAESFGIFNRIDQIDESSFFHLAKSSLLCLLRNFRVDTVVDLEVYSRLTSVMSTLTAARNRIGFYLETVFWRKGLNTHLIFFNRSSGAYRWYDAIGRLLGAEPAPIEMCRRLIWERLGPLGRPAGSSHRIAIGHSCSGFAEERMLNEKQWLSVFQQQVTPADQTEVLLLGTISDRDLAARIINVVGQRYPHINFQNLCGDLSLIESLRVLATCQVFWGIDSALLHYARLFGLESVSYWGPTDPATRLRPMPRLKEAVHYGKVPCSPCVHVAEDPPCGGDNVCVQSLFNRRRNYDSISWLAYGNSKGVPCHGDR